MTTKRTELAGSHRPEPEGAVVIGEPGVDETVTTTVYLRNPVPMHAVPGSAADLEALARPTTRRELAERRAVEYERAAATITRFAARHDLAIHDVDLAGRRLTLHGPTARMARAFGTSLRVYDDGRRRFRSHSGPLSIPHDVEPWMQAVLGLDHRPVVRRRLASLAQAGAGEGLWPREVAGLYGILADDGLGMQCVGLIALGGGYLPSDLEAAAANMGVPVPVVIAKSVAGATNDFGGGTAADAELALDLQVVAGVAPGVRVVIYFAANDLRSLAEAIHQAVFDDVNRPQVLSISWGSAERFWPESARAAVQSALADAVRLRISVVAASGDFLATGGLVDGAAHVFFPGSSPYVLGCGGTQVTLGAPGAQIANESVWNDGFTGTGGGISDVFATPTYQTDLVLPPSVNDGGRRRGVPDVAAVAGPHPG